MEAGMDGRRELLNEPIEILGAGLEGLLGEADTYTDPEPFLDYVEWRIEVLESLL